MPHVRPVTLVCVLRSGGVYTPEWARKLYVGARQHLPEAEFRVLTDLPTHSFPAGTAIPLQHDWPGWWSLVEWWRPGLFQGRVLAMGLDTLLVGSLADIASCTEPIAGISDFYQPRVLASGVMTWEGDAGAHIYETFARNPAAVMRHQRRMDPWMRGLIPRAARLQDLYPRQIVSYKAHARSGIPPGARIVCGHGSPKFSEARAGWAHLHWQAL